MSAMTTRERWLGAARLEPVDRIPFWPKLNASYPKAQEAPFSEMAPAAVMDWIGADKHVGAGNCCVREVRKTTSTESTREGNSSWAVYQTPHGALTGRSRFDAPSHSWHPMEYPVKTPDDIEIMTEWHADAEQVLDEEAVENSRRRCREIGQDAVTAATIGTSAVMWWLEHLAGIENGHFFLIEHPEKVEALLDAMHRRLRRRVEIACEHCPADLLYLSENTSTTVLSPTQYRKYNVPHLMDYARIAQEADRLMVFHMCGHLKLLLTDLRTIPVRAFEAFTSPPVGNTTFLDGRTGCPDKCLVGGTNAYLWTQPAGKIIAELERDLDAMPHHRGLAITSAGVMPPRATPQTIKAVADWVHAYPARM
jgi:uroporphyrinogen-III decarboxylase